MLLSFETKKNPGTPQDAHWHAGMLV